MVILNSFLMALVGAAMVGLLVWSVLTQHRDEGSEDVRFGRVFRSAGGLCRWTPRRGSRSQIDPPLAPQS